MRQLQIHKPLIILFLAIQFLLIACDDIPSQDPKDTFHNGKLPRVLEVFKDQLNAMVQLASEDQIERVKRDRITPGIVTVGVIDNGTDITATPRLSDTAAYDLNANGTKVTGYGWDFMGNDAWPHPWQFDPSFFAFGAKDVIEGRIHEPVEDPIGFIAKINQAFVVALQEEIAADETLAASHFGNIKPHSMSIAGAMRLTMVKDNKFDQEDYDDAKENVRLVTTEKPTTGEGKTLENKVKKWLKVKASQWEQIPNNGLPDTGDGDLSYLTIWGLEHADRFNQALRRALKRVDEAHSYKKHFAKFQDFTYVRFWSGSSDSDKLGNAIQKLQEPIYYVNFPERVGDSLGNIVEQTNNIFEQEAEITGQRPEQTEQAAKKQVQTFLDEIEFVNAELGKAEELDLDERKHAEDVARNMPVARTLTEWFFEQRGYSSMYGEHLARAQDPELERKRVELNQILQHPYLVKGSVTNSHSTHVADTVIGKDARGRLRHQSFRVTTSSHHYSEVKKKEMKATFVDDFKAWLASPIVQRGLQGIYHKEFDQISEGLNLQTTSPSELEANAETLIGRFSELIGDTVNNNALSLVFVEDVKNAVKEVGKRKLKFANVSLGDEFNMPQYKATQSLKKRLAVRFKTLLYEYFKWRVAETIHKHAPNTLFGVAAGNSGAWLDGVKKTSVPALLTTPYFEDLNGQEVPNNQLTNTVTVLSLDEGNGGEVQQLSNFTNLPLTMMPKVVAALGENVLAAISSFDRSGHNKIFDQFVGVVGSMQLVDDDTEYGKKILLELLKRRGIEEPTEDQLSYEASRVMYLTMWLSNIGGAARSLSAVINKVLMDYYNGTSMATPNTIGLMASMYADEIEERGLTEAEAHALPEYQPAALLERFIKTQTQPYESQFFKSGNLVPVAKVEESLLYTQAEPMELLGELGRRIDGCKLMLQNRK